MGWDVKNGPQRALLDFCELLKVGRIRNLPACGGGKGMPPLRAASRIITTKLTLTRLG
jgi:hypothetical protein